MSSESQNLVAGRDCGTCEVCCIVPSIDAGEIQKASSARCTHCTQGCAIYETRPTVCRDYNCGWRRLAAIPEDWRPDKSGVLTELVRVDITPSRQVTGIILTLIGNPLKTVRAPWFSAFVARTIAAGTPLYLALPGPTGHLPARIMLNGNAMNEALRRSQGRVKEILEVALAALKAHTFVKQPLDFSGNDVSGSPWAPITV
jgi:hypothetical protein